MTETSDRRRGLHPTVRETGAYALLLMFCLGSALAFVRIKAVQEQREQSQKMVSAGNQLVHLIGLYPVVSLGDEQSAFLFRTLTLYRVYDDLAYVIIHGADGEELVHLKFIQEDFHVPPEVSKEALFSHVEVRRSFRPDDVGGVIHEFSLPVYRGGERVRTVRLGLLLPDVAFFSLARVNFMATVMFLMLAAAGISPIIVAFALRGLKNLDGAGLVETAGAGAEGVSLARGEFVRALTLLDQSISNLKEQVRELRGANSDLTTQVGVLHFERKQVYSVLDSLDFGIIVLDRADRILRVNRYMLSLLGQSADELVDRPLQDTVAFAGLAELAQARDGAHRDGRAGTDLLFPERAPGKVFEASVVALRDGKREALGRIVTVNNVTDVKMANKNQKEFVTSLAHELLNPLTIIKTHNEMLMEGEIENAETRKEFCNTINDEIDRLNRLVQGFLDLSRMEMGSLHLSKDLVKTEWFVEDVLPVIEASARSKGVAFERRLPDKLPTLVADKELLKVALVNILGNAVKYTPSGGRVSFELSEHEGHVVFDVRDTGHGISKEDLPHIFEKFYRSPEPGIKAEDGSGMGLAITAEIVRLHGGSIEVNSEVGRGSHFCVRVPIEEYFLAGV